LPIPAIPICIGCILPVGFPQRRRSVATAAATIRDYVRARKTARAAPLGHIELERGSRRRVASAARLIGTEFRNGER